MAAKKTSKKTTAKKTTKAVAKTDTKKPAKGKRGSKSASLELNNTASKAEISNILNNNLYWYKREIVKTDEECADRLNEFFARMAATGEIPTVEKMCLAMGTVTSTVNDWQHGTKGPVRASMIKKAKQILAALDAELAASGKIDRVVYIFRAKNFFGMVDKKEYTLEPKNPLGDQTNPDEIRKRLSDGIPDEDD